MEHEVSSLVAHEESEIYRIILPRKAYYSSQVRVYAASV